MRNEAWFIARWSAIAITGIGLAAAIGGTIWNELPSDGANIGAALLSLLGFGTVIAGALMCVILIIIRLVHGRRDPQRSEDARR